MATELNAKNFDEAIKNPLVLVDFWADWCMPCKMLAPAIEQIAEEYKGKVFVGKVDIDKNPELAEKYSIMSIPNLIIFKDGKPMENVVGAVPKGTIKAALDKYLKK
jgi:thioredoxin 1